MGEFRMPSLGADMETGKLVEWLVVPGQRVRRGDIVAMVEQVADKVSERLREFEAAGLAHRAAIAAPTPPVSASSTR